jgi:hypothetical protein
MALLPVQKAYYEKESSSAYIFYCPQRAFPVIFTYTSLARLANEMNVKTPLALFEIKDLKLFDSIGFVLDESSQELALLSRGFSLSRISNLTDIHPIELALYFTSIAYMDDITMAIILERTNNTDLPPREITWGAGERVAEIASEPVLSPRNIF